MPFTPEQVNALQAKLDGSQVKTRAQSGRTLSYIEGWTAISEANRIFGFDGWHRSTIDMIQIGEPYQKDGKWRVAYRAKVVVFAGEVTREGSGYGSGIDMDLNSAHESALKEAETDAMKRALMTFGNPFGLALYDKTQANVEHGGPSLDEDQESTFKTGALPPPPRKPNGLPEEGYRKDGSRTSHALKQDIGKDPDAWDQFEREIDEATSLPTLETLAKGWAHIATRDKWNPEFRDLAKGKINARKQAIMEAMSPAALAEVPLGDALRASVVPGSHDDIFPGDRFDGQPT